MCVKNNFFVLQKRIVKRERERVKKIQLMVHLCDYYLKTNITNNRWAFNYNEYIKLNIQKQQLHTYSSK